jgi:hypothetical protein
MFGKYEPKPKRTNGEPETNAGPGSAKETRVTATSDKKGVVATLRTPDGKPGHVVRQTPN